MKGYLPEEIRTNWKKRGAQSADWVDRLKPEWSKLIEEANEALKDEEVQNYVDIEKVKGLIEKYKNLESMDEDINKYEVRLILIPLIFYKFLLQYRKMIS